MDSNVFFVETYVSSS